MSAELCPFCKDQPMLVKPLASNPHPFDHHSDCKFYGYDAASGESGSETDG